MATAIGSCSLALAPLASATAADDGTKASVSVFHGIPDTPVDVYADSEELIPDFAPGTLTEPLELAPGTYDIEVFQAGADPDTADPLLGKSVDAAAGADATVVAHLSESGTPQLNAFVNDTSAVGAGQARLTARHVAAAPAVDVRADGAPVLEGLSNPDEADIVTEAGTVRAEVTLAGTQDVAIGPSQLELAEGANTIVYAWGSAEDDNLALKVQVVGGLHSAPNGVEAGGNGALADSGSKDEPVAWIAAMTAIAATTLGGTLILRRRSVTEER